MRISANCHCCWQKYGFVVIDKDSLRKDDTEKDLMSMRYLNVLRLVVVNVYYTTFPFKYNMITTKSSKIARG